MNTQSPTSLTAQLAHRVEAFESALAADPAADFARFLPSPGHPLYPAALGELIRVDQENAWTSGRPRRLGEYTSRFPAVLEQSALLAGIAFEEYRQRRRAGEPVRAAEYRLVYGVDVTEWPDIGPGSSRAADDDMPATNVVATPTPRIEAAAAVRNRSPTAAAEPPDESVSPWETVAAALPEPGSEFLGFHLLEELGRGAFGRVYLARQGDLAGRLVAVKVACDIVTESHTLAQLQHPNIVPVYSLHRAGPFQAACMPYLGRTTLADVLKHLCGRPSLPSSGKDLRSTLNVARHDTTPASEKAPAVSAPTPSPLPSLPAAPPAPAADGWSRLDALSYVEAVLCLGGQLAAGLAHAHARGILHRDLKPANVLLTDEGRPMLLDFNLAEDTKARDTAERAAIGGTLPYMAPEHVEAFRASAGRLDARCDLYGLGVILFELLTGRRPFPNHKGPIRDTVVAMLADRRGPVPSVRQWNPAVSPAVQAVIHKCLAADPARRYQSAADLREDIDRHLSHRPLKFAANPCLRERVGKWGRRHPRLSSSATVAAVALVVLAGAGAAAYSARERGRDWEARGLFADHQTAFRDAQAFLDDRNNQTRPRLDVGLNRLRAVIARYGVPEDPAEGEAWLTAATVRHLTEADRDRLAGDMAEVFYLMARVAYHKARAATGPEREGELDRAAKWNALAGKYGTGRLPQAVPSQAAEIAALRAGAKPPDGDPDPAGSAREQYLAGYVHVLAHRDRAALPFLRRATILDPANYSAWFVLGQVYVALHQFDLAAGCFTACVALSPDSAPALLNRGLALVEGGRPDEGKPYLDRALVLDPMLAEAYRVRARFHERRGEFDAAVAEITKAIENGNAPVRYYFIRSRLRQRLNDEAGARADRDAGLRREPADELSWLARSEARQEKEPEGALADAERALAENPYSMAALEQVSMLQSEKLHRPADALATLDRAVERHPDQAPFYAGRGVRLERAGQRDRAVRDAGDALRWSTSGPTQYQVGCIYALTSKANPDDRREAIRLVYAGLRAGAGWEDVDSDPDLDPIRGDEEFRKMLHDARQRAPKR